MFRRSLCEYFSMAKQKGRTNAAAAADTRRRLLNAGAEEFFKNPSDADTVFRGVSLQRVASRAGRHRNSIYEHWEDKKAYLEDLTRYLIGDSDVFAEDFSALERVAREVLQADPLTAIMTVANADVESLIGNQVWRAMELVAIGYIPLRQDLHEAARQGYAATDSGTYGIYSSLLERAGRSPRKPFDEPLVGKILQALVEGAGIRQIFDPEAFVGGTGERPGRGPYAYAVAALLSVLTAGPKDDRTVEQLLGSLLESDAGTRQSPS